MCNTLTVVMASQEYAYVQTHPIVYTEHVQCLYINFTPIKKFKKLIENDPSLFQYKLIHKTFEGCTYILTLVWLLRPLGIESDMTGPGP